MAQDHGLKKKHRNVSCSYKCFLNHRGGCRKVDKIDTFSIGLVKSKKVKKVVLQIRTYFQGYAKITFLKGGGTGMEGHSIQRQE